MTAATIRLAFAVLLIPVLASAAEAPTAPPPRPRAQVEEALKKAPRPPENPRPVTLLLSSSVSVPL